MQNKVIIDTNFSHRGMRKLTEDLERWNVSTTSYSKTIGIRAIHNTIGQRLPGVEIWLTLGRFGKGKRHRDEVNEIEKRV